jgi:hypothetical protein
MPSYWWQCAQCNATRRFDVECGVGIVRFLWDQLLPANWDQSLLVRPCSICSNGALRITYEFPREDRKTLRVLHIFGLGPLGPKKDYLPMMWETSPAPDLKERWFDFKYMSGRSNWGLNKAAVFSKEDLLELFRRYREKANDPTFLCE